MALFRYSVYRSLFKVCQQISQKQLAARTISRWVAPTLRELEKRRKKAGPKPLQHRSTFLEWNYDAELYAFGKRIGEEFNRDLLQRALVHKSYVIQQEMKGNPNDSFSNFEDNSELIKEGENLIVDRIMRKYKDVYPNLVTSAICTYLTSKTMLAHVASYMGVKDIILCADFPVEESTLANTFKAITAALNQTNTDRTDMFIDDFLICQIHNKDIFEIWDVKNPYELLVQLSKEKGVSDIEARLCNQSASNTILANYQVGLYSNKKLLGIGWGESIDTAKETAALDAIRKLQNFSV
ncbi:hypothetical protein RN001_011026 [Aquatica leii]|uniref:Large ribosomal subunit protein mL44 n=1 Tax=Aquatica leii TaxID=1421715 RepID=A0AAN7SQL8_9COLE|nr:hypothetical protein RN001_011026 [Aquatica leii]